MVSTVGRLPRHIEGNILIEITYAQLEIPSILEPNHLVGGEGWRPDGVTAFAVKQGKCVTWDYTCKNTLSDTCLFQNAEKAGQAAIAGERTKIGIYEERLKDYIFVPVAVETFGSWGLGTY